MSEPDFASLETAAAQQDASQGKPVVQVGDTSPKGARQQPNREVNASDRAPKNGAEPGGRENVQDTSDSQGGEDTRAAKPAEPPRKTAFQLAQERKAEREHSKSEADRQWKAARLKQREYDQKLAELEQQRQAQEPTPEQVIQYAAELEQNGDTQGAANARQYAQQLHWTRVQRQTQDENLGIWNNECNEIAKEDQEFANPESPLGKRVRQIMDDQYMGPRVRSSPYGIHYAYTRAKLEQIVGYLSIALGQNKELKEEVANLKKKFGSAPSSPRNPTTRTFDNMTREEQFAEMEREASRLDTGRTS